MCPGYHCSHAVGYGTHHHSWLGCDSKAVYLVARVIYLSEQRVWYCDKLVGTPVDVYSVHLVVHSHYLIICTVYSYGLSARVTAPREEFLVNLLTYDTYFSSFSYVHFVEESSVEHYWRIDFGIVETHSRDICRKRLVAYHGILSASKHHRCDYIQFWHMLPKSFHVLFHHGEVSSFAKSLVWFCSVLCPHHSRVSGKPRKVFL